MTRHFLTRHARAALGHGTHDTRPTRSVAARIGIALLLVAGLCAASADAQRGGERGERGRRRGGRDGASSQPATEQSSQPSSDAAISSASAASGPASGSGPASAAGPAPARGRAAQSAAGGSTPASSEPGDEEDKDRYLAIIHGVVHTVSGPVLDGATLLCKNGKIIAIGTNVALPPETEVIDAAGKYVYPGLIAAETAAIHGVEPPEDTTNVFGLPMELGLASGITTAVIGNTAAKLTFGSVDDMVIRRNLLLKLNYSRQQPSQRAELRADLERVRAYQRELRQWELAKEADPAAKEPDKTWIKGKFEGYLKLLQREAIADVSVNTVSEIVGVCELATAFGLRLLIRGGHEAWLVPDVVGRAGAGVILTPRNWIDPDERLMRASGSNIATARILHDAGVPVAILPASTGLSVGGVAGRDLIHLNMEAAFAVRGGLSNDAALRTITLDAARVLGIDDRVGSIEVGKDADLVITDGDMLNFMSRVHFAVVNGRLAYDKAKDTLYAHVRPEGKPEVADFDDIWPRRLAWPVKDPRAASRPAGSRPTEDGQTP